MTSLELGVESDPPAASKMAFATDEASSQIRSTFDECIPCRESGFSCLAVRAEMKLPDGSLLRVILSENTSNSCCRAGGNLNNWDFNSANNASNNWEAVGAVQTVF